jgi:hypothetical protein
MTGFRTRFRGAHSDLSIATIAWTEATICTVPLTSQIGSAWTGTEQEVRCYPGKRAQPGKTNMATPAANIAIAVTVTMAKPNRELG